MGQTPDHALGVHRVLDPPGVLPQAARRLDPSPEIAPDEVRIAVERLNLDAASFRQLSEACGSDGAAVREKNFAGLFQQNVIVGLWRGVSRRVGACRDRSRRIT